MDLQLAMERARRLTTTPAEAGVKKDRLAVMRATAILDDDETAAAAAAARTNQAI